MVLLERRKEQRNGTHEPLPRGIRILAWARAVRWAGWGFGEALIPVFIASFSGTFLQMGLLSSTFEIAALASLPFIGVWTDRVPAKGLILLSLLLYPLVGINYFIAGSFKLATFVILAKVINGFTWELEVVAMETYYRRTTHRSKIAASFGYLDTWTNAAWICAALVGMAVVAYVPIHDLLFSISPFALIAYLVAARAPKDWLGKSKSVTKPGWRNSFLEVLTNCGTWNPDLRLLSALVLFSSLANALTEFFIPIAAYLSGVNLSMVVLLTVFGALPSLFGYQLGRLADMKSKRILVVVGLLIIVVVVMATIVISGYWFKLVVVFVIGLIIEMFDVIKGSLITTLGPAASYGIRGSTFECITVVGDLVAPVALGIALDIFGFSGNLLFVGGFAFALSIIYFLKRADASDGKAAG